MIVIPLSEGCNGVHSCSSKLWKLEAPGKMSVFLLTVKCSSLVIELL